MASVGKRKAERRGCHVKAQVIQPGGGEPIDCLILDFSATGARAKLNAQAELPSRFKLYIPSRPETKSVILRWTKGLEFGCEYSTGLADEKTFFELIDRVTKLERAGRGAETPAGEGGDPEILTEMARRIEALETRLDAAGEPAPASEGDAALDDDAAAMLERRIDKVAKTAEGFVKRSEQFLTTRMDEMEARLRATLAPDVADRLARLEAAAEAGAFSPSPARGDDIPAGPDPRMVARIADIEARLMSAPRANAPAPDTTALEARIEQTARRAEERADRVERFLMTRIDDIETQMISAPAAPVPVRSSEVADIDFRLHELAARFEELNAIAASAPAPSTGPAASSDAFERLAERVSDLEISMMELRTDGRAATPADEADIQRRIVEIEGRHAEIIGTLRNLLALLTATESRRHAG